jgi:hypothetical protein
LHPQQRLSVADARFDFETIAYNTGVGEQGGDFPRAIASHLLWIESVVGSPVAIALAQNRHP